MFVDLTVDWSALFGDKVRLPRPIEHLRATYQSSKPFPHIVIDDLFSETVLDPLLPEISGMRCDQWMAIDQDTRERTVRMRSAVEIAPARDDLLRVTHSAAFLYLLAEITGVGSLLPDPYLQGAGYALMRRGDYFHVHSDRNIAYETGLTRRLAMIIFLNKAWKTEYAGQLELWNVDATRCEVSIDPVFNRTVIFEVAYPNYHGVPTRLSCPADRIRQSFILYYHTVGSAAKNENPHTSIFAPRLHGTNRLTLRSIARDLAPPLLSRAFRRFVKPSR
ncbi:MAG: 2OG-Fe(II) oxygenase [Pseudomonadota bacterium]|nr:2OG-Fe(II) oxygenase [Pseudomonadota bacterium]